MTVEKEYLDLSIATVKYIYIFIYLFIYIYIYTFIHIFYWIDEPTIIIFLVGLVPT